MDPNNYHKEEKEEIMKDKDSCTVIEEEESHHHENHSTIIPMISSSSSSNIGTAIDNDKSNGVHHSVSSMNDHILDQKKDDEYVMIQNPNPNSTSTMNSTNYDFNSKVKSDANTSSSTTQTTTNNNTKKSSIPSSPLYKIKSKYKGSTIKNVNGTGDDYTPFVGCEDINDLIANLNNTSEHSFTSSNDNDSASKNSSYYYGSNGKKELNASGITFTPPKLLHGEVGVGGESGIAGMSGSMCTDDHSSHVMGSPSSVDLFNTATATTPSGGAYSNNNRFSSGNGRQYQHDEDDNSTIATQGTNATFTSYQKSTNYATTANMNRKKMVRIVAEGDDTNHELNNTHCLQNIMETSITTATTSRNISKHKHSTSKSSSSSSSSSKQRRNSTYKNQQVHQEQHDHWETFWSSEHDCPYYYNKVTKEVTWDNPSTPKPKVYEDEYVPIADYTNTSSNDHDDNNDKVKIMTKNDNIDQVLHSVNGDIDNIINHNNNSNDSTSIQSSSIISTSWERYWSDEHGCEYFHNPDTGETRWDDPTFQQRRTNRQNKRRGGGSSGGGATNTATSSLSSARNSGSGNNCSIRSSKSYGSSNNTGGIDGGSSLINDGSSANYSCVGSDYYEDDELVEISDFTKSKTTTVTFTTKDSTNVNSVDATETTVSTKDVSNKVSSSSGDNAMKKDPTSQKVNQDESHENDDVSKSSSVNMVLSTGTVVLETANDSTKHAKKELKRLTSSVVRKVEYAIRQYQKRYKSVYDLSSDRPITGADLAHQRRVNLIRKRRRKKRIKRGLVATFIMTFGYVVLCRLFNRTNTDINFTTSSSNMVVNDSVEEDHSPFGSHVNSSITQDNMKKEGNHSNDQKYQELKKLRESLDLIQSAMMKNGNDKDLVSEKMDLLDHKLNELKQFLDQVENEKEKVVKADEVQQDKLQDMKSLDRKSTEERKQNAEIKTKSNADGSFKNMTNNILSYMRLNHSVSLSQSKNKKNTEAKKMSSEMSLYRSVEPESSKHQIKKINNPSKPVSQIQYVSSAETHDVKGTSYFDKLHKVVQTLGLALDAHLDLQDIADVNDNGMAVSINNAANTYRNGDNISNQISKILVLSAKTSLSAVKKVSMPIQQQSAKTAAQLSHKVKKTIPNVHNSISIGTKQSIEAAEKVATIVKTNVPIALHRAKYLIETIVKNEQVVAIKHHVVATAYSAGKNVAKETVNYVRTLDYDGLVEKGVISTSIIFPDTRSMHCTIPIFKKMIKRCSRSVTSRRKQSSIPDKIFLRKQEVVSPSTEGGWSTPIWKSCDNGNCQQPVSKTFKHPSEQNDDENTWARIVSAVVPKECKKSQERGSDVDIECFSNLSS